MALPGPQEKSKKNRPRVRPGPGPPAHGPLGPWAHGPMGPWALGPWALGPWAFYLGPWALGPWALYMEVSGPIIHYSSPVWLSNHHHLGRAWPFRAGHKLDPKMRTAGLNMGIIRPDTPI